METYGLSRYGGSAMIAILLLEEGWKPRCSHVSKANGGHLHRFSDAKRADRIATKPILDQALEGPWTPLVAYAIQAFQYLTANDTLGSL